MLWCVYIQMLLTPDTEDKNIYYCPGVKVDVGVRRAGKSLYIDIFFSGLSPFHMAIVVKGLGDCGQLPGITLRWWGRGGMKEFAFIYRAIGGKSPLLTSGLCFQIRLRRPRDSWRTVRRWVSSASLTAPLSMSSGRLKKKRTASG